MNNVAIVQARMSSTRLPGKVLMPLGKRNVIGQVFHQLSYCRKLDRRILATSVDASDDPLAEWAHAESIEVFRGNLQDVLDRFYRTAKWANADTVVRITGDCPLIDPTVVDKVLAMFFEGGYDYVSNSNPPTFPDGMDTEVFTFASLEESWRIARLASEREHVTPYIRNHNTQFKIGNLENDENLESVRLTLDNPEDYKLISLIYDQLEKVGTFVSLHAVMNLVKNEKSLLEINTHIQRNEGYLSSLKKDKNK